MTFLCVHIEELGEKEQIMKQTLACVAIGLLVGVSQAQLIDDFSGDLSNYTHTVILDVDPAAGNTASYQITGETLEYNTSFYQSIEQSAFIYDGLSLAVGDELVMDLTHNGASQDLGLYVGGTAPTYNVRQDYIAVYARGDGRVFSRGFDGAGEYNLEGGNTPAYESLFIARVDTNIFEAGYYEGGVRNIISTRTPTTANAATYVGFYNDVRAAGVLGSADNLRIIPEPASIALLGLFGLLLRRR